MREPMTEAELDRARECEHECSVMERGVVSGLVAEVERLRAVTVAYWARFGAVPEDGENILAKREADARRAAEARIAELEEALIDVAVKCEDLWGRAMNLDGWQLRREVDAIKLRAEAAKPTPPPAVEQGDAFICPMGHSETHYGADMEDERPCCDKCGRRMVPAPSPAPAEPLAKVDAALNRVMEGETMTATASDDGSGHVTVKVATENPAHATSRGDEPCGTCGGTREITRRIKAVPTGYYVDVPCPSCSPPAAAKDEGYMSGKEFLDAMAKAAPSLASAWIGPCVHGRDPYDRCDGCGELTPEQARAVAEAENFSWLAEHEAMKALQGLESSGVLTCSANEGCGACSICAALAVLRAVAGKGA